MEWVKGTTSGTFQCFFRGNVLWENANILRANTNAIVLRENANYLLKENAKFLGRTQYFCNMLQYGKLALLLFLVNWKVMCYLTSYLKKVIYVTRITCNALPQTLYQWCKCVNVILLLFYTINVFIILMHFEYVELLFLKFYFESYFNSS